LASFPIVYQTQGNEGPAVVMVHGFGASLGHWRKNLPVLAQNCRCYAIDLIGFGASAKPTPGIEVEYTFELGGSKLQIFVGKWLAVPLFWSGIPLAVSLPCKLPWIILILP
jgi:pimeloyl-ACP methyl ester carboxylesterase